jgi:hypothetical protein
LQDWEDEQLPPVFEGLLQQGNAAGAAAGGGAAAAGNAAAGAVEDPLGGLLGAILAPQGGFHANNQHGNPNNNNNNADNAGLAAAGGAAAAGDAGAGGVDAAGAAGGVGDAGDAAADAVLEQLLQELQQDQQQQAGAPAEAWQQINPWQPVDWGIVPLIPQQAAAAAVHNAPGQQPDQQQQQPAGLPQSATPTAAPAVQVAQLSNAPVARAYGDVLRGQRCLQSLDVCVTALCKVMRASSSPLAQLRQLRLHMLGEVRLAGGGLPWLPLLTRLEFYLPDERNWGEHVLRVVCDCLFSAH